MAQVPSVGRVVHVTTPEGCNAAIVAKVLPMDFDAEGTVLPDALTLTVFDEFGNAMAQTKVHEGTGNGDWHWPEYVPAT